MLVSVNVNSKDSKVLNSYRYISYTKNVGKAISTDPPSPTFSIDISLDAWYKPSVHRVVDYCLFQTLVYITVMALINGPYIIRIF